MKKLIFAAVLAITGVFGASSTALADTIPEVPSCGVSVANPGQSPYLSTHCEQYTYGGVTFNAIYVGGDTLGL